MRAPPLVASARHFGSRAYEHIRHGLAGVNRVVETGARLYGGIVQPILKHQFGVDTSEFDHALMGAYNDFATVRHTAQKIERILQS